MRPRCAKHSTSMTSKMPIERYRDVADMPRPPRLAGKRLVEAMAAVWERAHVRVAPNVPRGVTKFRSIEDAQRARQQRVLATLRRLRETAD